MALQWGPVGHAVLSGCNHFRGEQQQPVAVNGHGDVGQPPLHYCCPLADQGISDCPKNRICKIIQLPLPASVAGNKARTQPAEQPRGTTWGI